ncbi:MAG TPA: nuclear transport factor 2 family protein [Mycobacterium sp.]|uniref:nuclear transport factor 2 family protein n=1 Tax=Mycobacterium sp. TaxID=1785 RepID=UPI002D380074|nr:nuclear transport factor 2 family protein [Mycobacterium sp.]HZU47884.1 nuclear transport factor 2 family protein [Mycobacterium sp.]
MPDLPPIVLDSDVDPADRTSAIDFINRVNLLFDAGAIDAMLEAFLPDCVMYHTQGVNRGRAEMRRFFQQAYPYSVPGVSRLATNPIVDRDGDGVIVRYHNLLVRYAAPDSVPGMVTAEVLGSPGELPAIWVYSAMTDRLRRTDRGWRIFERHVGPTTMNDRLRPITSGPGYFDPYLHRALAR